MRRSDGTLAKHTRVLSVTRSFSNLVDDQAGPSAASVARAARMAHLTARHERVLAARRSIKWKNTERTRGTQGFYEPEYFVRSGRGVSGWSFRRLNDEVGPCACLNCKHYNEMRPVCYLEGGRLMIRSMDD